MAFKPPKVTPKAKPGAAPSPAAKKPTVPKPGVASATPKRKHTPKKFSIAKWENSNEGEKLLIYGKSGAGKTTLASMAPGAVFIGIDDGGRKIFHPVTGEQLDRIPEIEDFQDVRDAISQPGLFKPGQTLVIDTGTKLEEWAERHILETVSVNGKRVDSFRKYGWDGDRHSLDHLRLVLSDLDKLVSSGVNVVILCQLAQIRVPNAEGADYLEDGPKLQHRNDCSCRTELVEWADHVARIGYLDFDVQKDNLKAKAGKVISGDMTRAVYTGGAAHFVAKSRPISGYRIPPVIGFENEQDNSFWQFIFDGARVEETE